MFPNLSVADNLAWSPRPAALARPARARSPSRCSPGSRSAASSWPARCPAARSRCSPSPAALGTDPAVLLVDELSMGLAPMVVDELYDAVAEVAGPACPCSSSSSSPPSGCATLDPVYVMAHGVVTYAGPSAGATDAIHAAYLGAVDVTELFQFTLFGLMLGCVYAIAAMGLVLTYTVTGVFNFAHGAVGMLAAFCYFELRVQHGVPTPIAVAIVVLVLAPPLGLAAERLLRRFQGADYATSLVVTVALTVGLLGLAQRVFDPGEARNVPYLFGDRRFAVLDVPITYDRIAQVVVAARCRLRAPAPALRHAARRPHAVGGRRPRAGPPERRPVRGRWPGSAG